jgi:hypothetical protein
MMIFKIIQQEINLNYRLTQKNQNDFNAFILFVAIFLIKNYISSKNIRNIF